MGPKERAGKAPKAPKASGKSLTVQLELPSLISDTMKKWITEDSPKKVKLRHIKRDSYTDIREIYQDRVAAIKFQRHQWPRNIGYGSNSICLEDVPMTLYDTFQAVSDGIDAASKLKSKWTNDDVLTMLPGAGSGAQIKKWIPMVQVAVKVPGLVELLKRDSRNNWNKPYLTIQTLLYFISSL
ncbi:hypothetical protein M427DRAFT_39532 [Gonapodya prolifera JEL478]|uniref:Uncharacterized protein n=1 Tax=Gonapodya prolifera (strain JEL478) TaxID=1344416 RepID=A0A138ZXE1_GONPJ|nr:hypothetical protein M427DRAFT_39532 [Gonapodya prolifera JEL478]|eukprot:KXS09111.1 hypothetical protein M427DRAFT_39532 [Gonapodya prolifera JEL478]